MRLLRQTILTALALAFAASCAHADDADDALLRSRVYGELRLIAAQQWERVYGFALADIDALAEKGYDFARKNVRPLFAFAAGRAAFDAGDFKGALKRLALAERLAKDTGDVDLARRAELWRVGCGVALELPDWRALLNKADVEAEKPGEILLLAYLLDKLGVEMESKRKELYHRGMKSAADKALSPSAERFRAWLAYRIEGDANAYLRALPLAPDFPALDWSAPAGAKDSESVALKRVTSIEIYEASRLAELSEVYARRAYDLAPAGSETRVRAALRLGRYDEARRQAQEAASKLRATDPAEALHVFSWRILKAMGDRGAGREDALDELKGRFINPAFAEQRRQIYHAVAMRLAEAFLELGEYAHALETATSGVAWLEKQYRANLSSGQLLEYYDQTRPVYGALAHALFRKGDLGASLEVYGLVYPWHRNAWLRTLRIDPLFCVRYSALLFEKRDFALARELLYNYRSYGLLADYPHARQIHSVSAALEYLYKK